MIIIIDDQKRRWFKDSGTMAWDKTEPRQIAKGDRFRIYTSEGIPLIIKGYETFVASSDPYQIDGDWVIEIDL